MTSTPKWQSPRRLSRPVAKARPVDKQSETLRRAEALKTSQMRDRRRGYRRGVR